MEASTPKTKTGKINEEFFTDGASIVWRKQVEEKYEIASTGGHLMTLEGYQKYEAGFYIIQGSKGERYSMPPSKFAELKEDLGRGVATPKKILKLGKLADHSGSVKTSWGETLQYRGGEDYIIRHAKGDYGVVKKDIFEKTYESEAPSTRPARPLKLPTRLVSPNKVRAISPQLSQA